MHPLRRFRETHSVTLTALARKAGIAKSSLSRIETGRQSTTESMIRKLIAATGDELTANDFIAPSPKTSGPRGQ